MKIRFGNNRSGFFNLLVMNFKKLGSALLLVVTGLSAKAQFNPDYEHTVNTFGILPHEHNEKNCKHHKFCDHADSTHVQHAEQHIHVDCVTFQNKPDSAFADTVKFSFKELKSNEVLDAKKHQRQKPSLEN
ncbi:MAG: hypothetical protein CMI36_07835 [Owenweeksia sp.]|nr:hypothetical protein [Owenweeksia sp.]MBF98886.1 hypothetical protein [Owenweeksia sp.]HBF21067.1 hypothetical protein [Cryomorphaceae bacterium]